MDLNIITVSDLELVRSIVGTIELASELSYTTIATFDDVTRIVTIKDTSGTILKEFEYDLLISRFTEVARRYPIISTEVELVEPLETPIEEADHDTY